MTDNNENSNNRTRVNIKQTAKGKLYYDITVELINKSNDEVVTTLKDLKTKVEFTFPEVKEEEK